MCDYVPKLFSFWNTFPFPGKSNLLRLLLRTSLPSWLMRQVILVLTDMDWLGLRLTLQVITNGAYKSAVHRAITNASRARLSVATFHDPCKSATISPCAQLGPPCYRDVVYGSYVSAWYGQGPEGKRNIDKLLLWHFRSTRQTCNLNNVLLSLVLLIVSLSREWI